MNCYFTCQKLSKFSKTCFTTTKETALAAFNLAHPVCKRPVSRKSRKLVFYCLWLCLTALVRFVQMYVLLINAFDVNNDVFIEYTAIGSGRLHNVEIIDLCFRLISPTWISHVGFHVTLSVVMLHKSSCGHHYA